MTIQKIDIIFKDKVFQLVLEDGLVSFIDPEEPDIRRSLGQPFGLKITTLEGAKSMALKMIEACYEEHLVD